jgi:hypothetical protein
MVKNMEKKIWVVFLAALMLAGCDDQQTLTVFSHSDIRRCHSSHIVASKMVEGMFIENKAKFDALNTGFELPGDTRKALSFLRYFVVGTCSDGSVSVQLVSNL